MAASSDLALCNQLKCQSLVLADYLCPSIVLQRQKWEQESQCSTVVGLCHSIDQGDQSELNIYHKYVRTQRYYHLEATSRESP